MVRNNKLFREKRCRKNIATFLSLMGFRHDDPQTTIQVMHRRLDEIKQQQESQKKLSKIRKVVFKCGGYSRTCSSVIIQQNPPMPHPPLIQPPHNISQPLIVAVGNDDDDNNIEYGRRHTKLKDIIRQMGGSEVKLVIEKKLSKTDVKSKQGRLLIPVLKIKNPDFLTTDEKNTLKKDSVFPMGEKKKESISVWVFDPKGHKYTLNLAQWNMKNTANYVLKTNWNKVVKTNELKEEMEIQLFSFRVDQQLCFVIVVV